MSDVDVSCDQSAFMDGANVEERTFLDVQTALSRRYASHERVRRAPAVLRGDAMEGGGELCSGGGWKSRDGK